MVVSNLYLLTFPQKYILKDIETTIKPMLEYRLQSITPLEAVSWGKDITLVTACFPAKTSKKLNSG